MAITSQSRSREYKYYSDEEDIIIKDCLDSDVIRICEIQNVLKEKQYLRSYHSIRSRVGKIQGKKGD